jgi:hypothetical protein
MNSTKEQRKSKRKMILYFLVSDPERGRGEGRGLINDLFIVNNFQGKISNFCYFLSKIFTKILITSKKLETRKARPNFLTHPLPIP